MNGSKPRIIPLVVLVAGLSVLYPLQRWIDRSTPREVISEERLYFASGETIKRMSLGLHGLVADVYWIRTIQYFGRKLIMSGEGIRSDTRKLRLDLLDPLLNIIVTLDPAHIPAYRFGAIFLTEQNRPAAVALLQKGIQANPDEWRLYQDLGYIHWQSGEYDKAADMYERGGDIPGARWWMRDMAGVMRIKGGSREVAYAVYRSYLESEDRNIRNQAEARLKQLVALDQIDAINAVLARYRDQEGACASSLRPFARVFASMKLALNEQQQPVDPEGFPYEFDPAACVVKLSESSTVPR